MKVFLSSTYLDLIEHRKAVVNALRTMGEEVEHMEIFGARDEEPTQASIEELDKCDVLVGVYAYRYGTVPKGSKTSVTEQEYLHAASKKIPILVFVVNPDYDWSPKKMDENLTKIKKFKVRVSSEHTPVYYTTSDNLASQVVASIGRLAKKLNPKLIPDSRISPPEPRRPTGSTLPYQPYFFGRDNELAIIADAISPDSRTWGALIDGPGGIGKTALAIRAAHLSATTLFDRKIFITAKVRELTAEGEAKLTDFTRPTYLAMLDELGKELGTDGLEKLAPDERPNELRLALAGVKALIIFDNLETLPEDERTRLPEGNKAIVTSRRRTDVDARLDRLARDEALQLIAELAAKYPRLARASQKEREDLYEITQGNPLFIRWIAGQLGREGSQCRTIAEACAFIDKAPKGNDPLEYIFGDLLGTFTADETKVLAALTYFTLPAKLKWIADMTDLPARAAEHWQESIPRNKAAAIHLRGIGHELNEDYPGAIAAYREAMEIWRCISSESNDVAIALNALADVERSNKDYPAAKRDYREALRIAKKNKHQEMIAGIPGGLAELALDREQWAEAESLAREALALAEKVGRQELIASDCHRIAIALLKQNKNLDEALSLSRRAVEIYTRLRHPLLPDAQETLAEIEKTLEEREKSKK